MYIWNYQKLKKFIITLILFLICFGSFIMFKFRSDYKKRVAEIERYTLNDFDIWINEKGVSFYSSAKMLFESNLNTEIFSKHLNDYKSTDKDKEIFSQFIDLNYKELLNKKLCYFAIFDKDNSIIYESGEIDPIAKKKLNLDVINVPYGYISGGGTDGFISIFDVKYKENVVGKTLIMFSIDDIIKSIASYENGIFYVSNTSSDIITLRPAKIDLGDNHSKIRELLPPCEKGIASLGSSTIIYTQFNDVFGECLGNIVAIDESKILYLIRKQHIFIINFIILLIIIAITSSLFFYSHKKSDLELIETLNAKHLKMSLLDKKKNRLLGIAAHDIRSPLSSILSIIDLIIGKEIEITDEEIEELLGHAYTSGKYVNDLVENMLDFSKIESGTLELFIADHDYKDFILETIALNKIIASKKNIKITLNYNTDRQVFPFDKNRMFQALNNLISNATKYSGENSEILINVKFENNILITEVKDHGKGIPAEDIDHIFKAYYTASSTYSDKSTGLGLVIVKSIINAHKGTIEVSSKQNKGTTFTFKIPQ